MSWAEIKQALNSKVGTSDFEPLDEMIETIYGLFYGEMLITESKTFTVPKSITKLFISGCGAGGSGANGRGTKAGGNAGQYVIQEEVSVNPGDVFTITVGAGNTVISSTGGYNKTLAANSLQTEYHTNVIGWETGFNGHDSNDGGSGGYGGAFGFGGGGGGDGVSTSSGSTPGEGGNGGSSSGGETTTTASLTSGAKGRSGTRSSSNWSGGAGGNAGGYGAGGGGGGYGSITGAGGDGSQGMVFIQWGTLQ